MRKLSTIAMSLAVLASAGCSGASSASSSSADASPSPAAKGTTDKRTGLPVYPGAMQSSTSDSSAGKMTSFMTDDSEQTVGSWYKNTLPASFAETDNSSNSSDPTIEFDVTADGKQTEKVYLSSVGQKTSIDVEQVK
jgi:hypothetical protein